MIAGAELFTGDALMITACLERKISFRKWLQQLGIIWISNALGALVLVGLLVVAGRHTFNAGSIAEFLLQCAVKKLHYGRWQAFSLGILCNILVCLGVWLAWAGKRAVDKIMGIIFPVTAFVACGFEHCVANMFYLPFAYVLKWLGYQVEGIIDITIDKMFFQNFLPVTLGNLIGGAVFVGLLYWIVYHHQK
ncbi:MAG: formate/nitrite transporter family protein [Candidatus Peribacteria bacterium]|jgi:formate transporter|nr:formate/nitrite transporter family protein [Candidatus Peribacteria bacterium]